MPNNNFIYLIVGKSGTGKTTLAKELCKRFGWSEIQSYTTRPPRYPGETGHIFVTDEEFDMLSDYVAYTKFDNCRYCATAQQVEENEVYVIDPAGVRYFTENYKGDKTVKVIYLTAKTTTLIKRMLQRGDKIGKVLRRIWHDHKVFDDVNNHPIWLFLDNSERIDHLAIIEEANLDEIIQMIVDESYCKYSMAKGDEIDAIFNQEYSDER